MQTAGGGDVGQGRAGQQHKVAKMRHRGGGRGQRMGKWQIGHSHHFEKKERKNESRKVEAANNKQQSKNGKWLPAIVVVSSIIKIKSDMEMAGIRVGMGPIAEMWVATGSGDCCSVSASSQVVD